MGIPKFYRWVSERYPCLNESVKDYQIPVVDNLYLDMNGIIHPCSHPSDDPHFRLEEEQILKNIFFYIEYLFQLIKPRKIFFLAVDGVAPRAKMNQQRARRFQSAKNAEDAEKKAVAKGNLLPDTPRFDSNCITPGTEFMDRLDNQLQYFITQKISQDFMWQKCKIVYSGHKTPGEGEHKIMEYIRFQKSQPDYDPYVRHCLYGQDADLIILGLTCHEPYFILLREEVKYGKDKNKNITDPSKITFYLFHLNLLREYIDLEFFSLHNSLNFEYNLENIIDDWILLGFLVGNDFIPHLPELHIHTDAISILYRTYKESLPMLDGYINNKGKLNLSNFEKFMVKLSEFERERFDEFNADLKYFNSKRTPKNVSSTDKENGVLEDVFFKLDDENDNVSYPTLELSKGKLSGAFALDDMIPSSSDEEGDNNDYDIFDMEFIQHRHNYYKTKMLYSDVTHEVLEEQATSYVRGIQWILNYYYSGICSWSWFYPHHYAPCISDIRGFTDLDIEFQIEKPFLPFQQLLAVLPPQSANLMPICYQALVLNDNSPIIDYYPRSYKTDLNGKYQDWEAVVLLPFIDENVLLKALEPLSDSLCEEEYGRNSHGPMYIFTYTTINLGEYKALEYFPPVSVNHAYVEKLDREKWILHSDNIYKGLCKNLDSHVYLPGFSTFKHLKYKCYYAKGDISIFEQRGRRENLVIEIEQHFDTTIEKIAGRIINTSVYVCWPHLIEAEVHSLSDGSKVYINTTEGVMTTVLQDSEIWKKDVEAVKDHYLKRWGIDIGNTFVLVYAKILSGKCYEATQDNKMVLKKKFSKTLQPYALQAVAVDLKTIEIDNNTELMMNDYFSSGSKVFMIGQPYYGCSGEILDGECRGRLRVHLTLPVEPDLAPLLEKEHQLSENYYTSYNAAQYLGISNVFFNRITGSFICLLAKESNNKSKKLEVGLNLKNNKKNWMTIGYTRKDVGLDKWFYSQTCIDAVGDYLYKFPELADGLQKLLSCVEKQDNMLCLTDVFSSEECASLIYLSDCFAVELEEYFKNAEFSKAIQCQCGSDNLHPATVSLICKEVSFAKQMTARGVTVQIRPHLLFKPNNLNGSIPPDDSVTFSLFDRIVNVGSHTVPLGTRGTIISIHNNKEEDALYNILFDDPFPGGHGYATSCSANRCFHLRSASIVNITHGFRSSSKGTTTAYEQYLNSSSNQNKIPCYSQQMPNKNKRLSEVHPEFIYTPNAQLSSLASIIKAKSQLITDVSEVPLVIHGTFYSRWPQISKKGLEKGNREKIPFLSYIPQTFTGPKAFQLHVYIDLACALADGLKFFLLSEGQIFSSGDKNGFIPPKYFSKVVDVSSKEVIYPFSATFRLTSKENAMKCINYPIPHSEFDNNKQPLNMLNDIGSQVRTLIMKKNDGNESNLHYSLQARNEPIRMREDKERLKEENRIEVSIDDLFRSLSVKIEEETRSQKDRSIRSAFIPTQVIRQITPKMPVSQLQLLCDKSEEKTVTSHARPAVTTPKIGASQTKQKKRPSTSRLAINFDISLDSS